MIVEYGQYGGERSKKMAKKKTKVNLRVVVRYCRCVNYYDYGIYLNRKCCGVCDEAWKTKKAAIRNAKKFAEIAGIPFDGSRIVNHDC